MCLLNLNPTASELDGNWHFLVEFFATFAPLGVPSLSKFKVPPSVKPSLFCLHTASLIINTLARPFVAGSFPHMCLAIWAVCTTDCEEGDQGLQYAYMYMWFCRVLLL